MVAPSAATAATAAMAAMAGAAGAAMAAMATPKQPMKQPRVPAERATETGAEEASPQGSWLPGAIAALQELVFGPGGWPAQG